MFRPKFNPFLVIWVIKTKNLNKHKTDCCNVPFLAAPAAATGLWTEPQTAGEFVSFLSFQPVNVFFLSFIFMIFDSKYFQAIQTAVFYKKITFKMFKCNFFMFLDVQGSCDQNQNEC